jgi:hypothetical protein
LGGIVPSEMGFHYSKTTTEDGKLPADDIQTVQWSVTNSVPEIVSVQTGDVFEANTLYYLTTYIKADVAQVYRDSPTGIYIYESDPVAFSTLPSIDIEKTKVRMGNTVEDVLVYAEFYKAAVGNVPIKEVKIYYDTNDIHLKEGVAVPGGVYPPPTGAGGVYPTSPGTIANVVDPPLTKDTGEGGDYTDAGFTANKAVTRLDEDETYYIVIAVTNDRDDTDAVLIEYKTVDTTLNVTVPVKMIFAAFASEGGVVRSPAYTITTEAYFPVNVTLAEFNEEEDAGLTLMDTEPDGTYELGLKFIEIASEPSFQTDWITLGSQADGFMVRLGSEGDEEEEPPTGTASFEITGSYGGPFTETLRPKYAAVFRFELEYDEPAQP